ncbi:unnamed protein product [Effrenium voratum]|uniref:Ubiquitin-like domain-containing protein n=1 Tax=Effrenium voratum TaxID=2562239 RepID=A0AA36HVR4_9DINO|nr:unnamed protein product [Effrenium voratum]CAJ1421857.1 unnamed protein product [Effrenium voratum]
MPCVKISLRGRTLQLDFGSDARVAAVKERVAKDADLQPWRVDVLRSGQLLSSEEAIGEQLEVEIRQGPVRSITVDAGLLNSISSESLQRSHFQHLREDLGDSSKHRFQEIALTITDWHQNMPKEVTETLVDFLSSRTDDPKSLCLVHLDFHGKMPEVLAALRGNRFFESQASSVEVVELSLEGVDPSVDFLPLFPNLRSLRMYKPEFPPHDADHYSLRLLALNSQGLQDVAMVRMNSTRGVFDHVMRRLAGAGQGYQSSESVSTTLWVVSGMSGVLSAMTELGEALRTVRTESREGHFLRRLGKLNIHVDADAEGFGAVRAAAGAALNQGLDEEQQKKRKKVLTNIRSTRAARNPHETLMCLLEVLPLSLGLATSEGTRLLEPGACLAGAVLTAKIVVSEAPFQRLAVECSNMAGDVVISLGLGPESTAGELQDQVLAKMGWQGALLFFEGKEMQRSMSLRHYELLTIKEEKDLVMTRVIFRNTLSPTKASKIFTTYTAQESVVLQILEGEMPLAGQNIPVAELRLDGIAPCPSGLALIEVTFDLDANSTLHVTALDHGSGARCESTLTCETRPRVDVEELKRMVSQSEAYWAQTAALKARSEVFTKCAQRLLRQKAPEVMEILAWLEEARDANEEEYKAQLKILEDLEPALVDAQLD